MVLLLPLLDYNLPPDSLKCVWLCAALLLLLLLAVAQANFFHSREGRDFVVTAVTSLRANNLAGIYHYLHIVRTLVALPADLLLFIVCKGNRKCLFSLMHHELGPVFPYQQVITISKHHGVKVVMTSPNQPHGHCIGTPTPDTLVFMSIGSAHERYTSSSSSSRSFLHSKHHTRIMG